ncbi:redoxin family protein [Ilumatobacter nonamiensis]|uniref:redoxin family protein n=1 Tax=Ilumatobacter nonamiensis TaxID=467093 RepID=UPI00034A4D0C|nr:redoxin family protein [Ilumatobacter nonamiensis]
MDRRRVAALVSLLLVGSVVAGLLATAGGDDADGTAAATTAAPESSPATTTTPPPVDDSSSAASPPPESSTTAPSTTPATTVDADTPELPNRGPHPEFLPVQEWLQTDATSFDDFDGTVVAVQFWTFGCSNCQATYPHMRDLHAKYSGDDFEIVGVHAPEFDHERDVDAIAQAASDNGLTWPIAVDNEKLNFRSWQDRRFWPRIFLIDADGNVRYDHIGEGAYDEIDAAVGALIAESKA